MSDEKKLSTWEVLRYKFPENEYVLIAEVAGGNGYLDFMLINLWGSRGLAITGIERKSNRGDWLKELKSPKKQEAHFKYCDYFYLLTDKDDVAKIEEIPDAWGWYHINKSQILKTMKLAPKQSPIPVDRKMLCNMIRRAAAKDKYVHVDSLDSVVENRVQKEMNHRLDRRDHAGEELEELKKEIEVFEKASGLAIFNGHEFWAGKEKIGTALKALLSGSVDDYKWRLKQIKNNLEEALKRVSQTITDIQV